MVGGAIGALLRFSIANIAYHVSSGLFPWGTLVVNLLGSFIIGLLWGLLDINNLSPHVKNLVFIGLLGSFTTFSTFTLDTMNLFHLGEAKLAVLNVILSNGLGLILVFSGYFLGRQLILLSR